MEPGASERGEGVPLGVHVGEGVPLGGTVPVPEALTEVACEREGVLEGEGVPEGEGVTQASKRTLPLAPRGSAFVPPPCALNAPVHVTPAEELTNELPPPPPPQSGKVVPQKPPPPPPPHPPPPPPP
jgi:hypothetical protein